MLSTPVLDELPGGPRVTYQTNNVDHVHYLLERGNQTRCAGLFRPMASRGILTGTMKRTGRDQFGFGVDPTSTTGQSISNT